ncbi:MAG TPA: MerR family transcriptional regulator [Desulfitobacteriaceae bacterium]|nr:MerR family transcriptional regulator [Desulfitobacteriaceae bacterium]
MPQEYRISELAHEAGVTKRTIHYYIGRGLLPPPEGAGVGSTYGEEHLLKLLIIKKLQQKYLPLDKIRGLIANLNLEEVRKIARDEKVYASWIGSSELVSPKEDLSEAGIAQPEENLPWEPLAEQIQKMTRRLDNTEGRPYMRVELGLGIELHYPVKLFRENPDLINSIKKYCRKMIDDK